jgi:homoserine/homoserine lactone efflux protein
MMQLSTWFAFFLMMTAIAYTPGPMTMFAMSSSVKHGFYRTLPGIFGGSAAYMVQMVVVYLGLGVIVQNSTVVFNTIKWVGVIYLILLGVRNWRQSIRDLEIPRTGLPISPVRQFSWGLPPACPTPSPCWCSRSCFPSLSNRIITPSILLFWRPVFSLSRAAVHWPMPCSGPGCLNGCGSGTWPVFKTGSRR